MAVDDPFGAAMACGWLAGCAWLGTCVAGADCSGELLAAVSAAAGSAEGNYEVGLINHSRK